MRLTIRIALMLVLTGCSAVQTKDTVLDGPFNDYFSHKQSELPQPFPFSARSLHFVGTQYVLSILVDCREMPIDEPSSFVLLQLPRGVDVPEWITYHTADVVNEYSFIEPERLQMASGLVELTDTRLDTTGRSASFVYRLAADDVVFEREIRIPSIRTKEHACPVPQPEAD